MGLLVPLTANPPRLRFTAGASGFFILSQLGERSGQSEKASPCAWTRSSKASLQASLASPLARAELTVGKKLL